MSARGRLEARFRRAADSARAACGKLPQWPELRIPEPLLASMETAAALDGGAPPEELASYYCEKMPALLVELLADAAFAPLYHQPIDRARWPRLAAALDGLYAALAAAGLDPAPLVGAPSAAALLAARPSPAALYAGTLFASGLPLTGAYPADRARLVREINDPGSVIPEINDRGSVIAARVDLRLSGNLVHELCHGPADAAAGGAPWIVVEAAALHLGAAARAAHVFPDEPGEAVPGVARFVAIGDALAARFGEAALWRVLYRVPLAETFPPPIAAALEVAAWQDWLRRRHAPFARDAEAAQAWIKLACGAAPIAAGDGAESAARHPELLAAAARTPWSALAWWHEEPSSADGARVERAVRALGQVNRLAPLFETAPSEPPGGRITLDVAECRLRAAPRPDGVFGEPADWWFPPPLARRLHERGARGIVVENVTRARSAAAASVLTELSLASGPLAAETVLRSP
ncbi:MAG TPA: hypothetical protein VFF06_35235 [Polyangia bacterium]|nr:hypothetical protein [Polyangia bacterium]